MLLILSLSSLACLACVLLAVMSRRHVREHALSSALFRMFADASTTDEAVASTGVDASWLALRICGLSPQERIKKLAPEVQADVMELTDEITRLGAKLVKKGLLAYFPVTFEAQGKYQKISAPKTLFILTDRSRPRVLRLRAEIARAM